MRVCVFFVCLSAFDVIQMDRTIEIVRDDPNTGKLGNNNEILQGEDTNSISYKRR